MKRNVEIAPKKARAQPPFPFVLEALAPLSPVVRAFFSGFGVYVGERIVMILRERQRDRDDGVWLATDLPHHASLRSELPSMRAIEVFGSSGETKWQILPSSGAHFEDEALHACALVLRGDPRIGKVPVKKARRAQVEHAVERGAPSIRALLDEEAKEKKKTKKR